MTTGRNSRRWNWFAGLAVVAIAAWQAGGAVVTTRAAQQQAAGVSRAQAEQVYARIQALAGDWHGSSTKGWQATSNYRVIARGSAVLSTSRFQDEPNEGMATVFHMDGDLLVLTHYCEAGNQPRLALTAVEEGGRVAVFTFRDATNLSSRDRGHMDKAVFRFQDDKSFSSRWTWYQNGQERWLEEISYSRIRARATR